MSFEHQRFKQFLKAHRAPLPSTDKGKLEKGALNAIEKLKSRQVKESVSVVRSVEKRRPGRPSKPKEEKVRVVSMKLSSDTIAELKVLPFGRGVGSRVRELLSYFKRQEGKEIARAKLLRKLLPLFDAHLHHYLKLAKVNSLDSKAKKLLQELQGMAEKIQLMVDIFHWDGRDFRAYLPEEDVLTLQFALDFKREVCVNRSFIEVS